MKNYYLVVDIETTGQFVTKNDMLCFGAVLAYNKKYIDKFLIFIKPTKQWEERCKIEFWDKNPEMTKYILDKVEKEGVEANEAMIKFYEWVQSLPNKENITICSDNVVFDIGFINYYLSEANLNVSMSTILGRYKPIRDSSSFHAGIAHQTPDKGLWDMESAACQKLGFIMEKCPVEHDHNPLNDAKSIAWDIMEIERMLEEYNQTYISK